MRWGVVVFPGSNDDRDNLRVTEKLLGDEAVALWHKDRDLRACDAIVLVDMKLEFGRHQGKILLADEICPDTCRFWDKATGEKLDKDRFRRDLGGVEEAYQEVARRICGVAA